MAYIEEKDIIVYSYDAGEVLNADGEHVGCSGLDNLKNLYDWMLAGKSDEVQYRADVRFCLDEGAKEKFLKEFRSQYPDMKDDELEQDGGCYATFCVYGDGRCEMNPDGIVMYVNGSGYWLDLDEQDGKVIAYAFDHAFDNYADKYEQAAGESRGHIRLEACLQREVAKAYIEDAVRSEWTKCHNDKEYLKKLFPDLQSLNSNQNWSLNNIIVGLDKEQTDFIEFGLYYEGDDWKKQGVDSPYTIQAFHGDDVIFCNSILQEEYKDELNLCQEERER